MFYKIQLHKTLLTLMLSLMLPVASYAIDLGNESTADKADRFEFEEFHKEKGITLWEDKKAKDTTAKDTTDTPAAVTADETFEKGQELKVREAYKLGNDPALRSIQSLYEATEALHKQLYGYCPNGWAKEQEWHKPETDHFYIYYMAVCQ